MSLPATPAARSSRTACEALRGRDFLSIRDVSHGELVGLIMLARDIRRDPLRYSGILAGRTLATIFEKPSLRTRVSFHVAAYQLGGHAIDLAPQEIGLGQREAIDDVARTLDRMVSAIVVRTFAHELVERLAAVASIPVINGLTDLSHPCQAVADYFTMLEAKGRLAGLRLAFIGDGANNVATSLIFGAALLGVRMTIAAPPGYEPREETLAWARRHGIVNGGACRAVSSPEEAADGADVVYTDTWISMGQEQEAEERRRAFAGFQVTDTLLDRAASDAIFMHCLPAHPGEEVSQEVLDSARSVVFSQAENRLHTEKALLCALVP